MNHENPAKTITHYEYAGCVKNRLTGEHEVLFITEISPVLAKNRAIETATNANKPHDAFGYKNFDYDTSDVIVKKRTVVATYSDWEPLAD